jgi:hypothetical protein
MTREQIALALQQQQQRRGMPGQQPGGPFTPAPVAMQRPMQQPSRPAAQLGPMMGTPAPRPQEPPSPYGFQTGFNAAYGTPVAGDTPLMSKLMKDYLGPQGSEWT